MAQGGVWLEPPIASSEMAQRERCVIGGSNHNHAAVRWHSSPLPQRHGPHLARRCMQGWQAASGAAEELRRAAGHWEKPHRDTAPTILPTHPTHL